MASIELMFVEEHLKKLNDIEKRYTDNMTGFLLDRDQYASNVGSIAAVREIREEFMQLLKSFFPENYDRKRKY